MKIKLNCITQPLVDRETEEDIQANFGMPLRPEEYMIYCARVSNPPNRLNHETAPKLLNSLIRMKHWSPFEMLSIGFEIETSRATAQQILRHRSFSFQEFSQRYAEVTKVEPPEMRMQAEKDRQSSTYICDDPLVVDRVGWAIKASVDTYKALLADGIAKETARMVLPLCAQTTIVMHGTLRSWIHFLEQRCDEHAQKEIRLIAFEIRKQLVSTVPWTAKALGWDTIYDDSKCDPA